MTGGAIGTAAATLGLPECERFLVHEARLLDDGRFDEWLQLFTDDACYWVPSTPAQASPRETVSLIYDDRRLLETRVRRLASPRLYSQEPRSRTSRMVTNVSIEHDAHEGPVCLVRSKFQLVEFRRGGQRIFAGSYFHHLVRGEGALRIKCKRVDLINCDGAMEGIVVPL
jgi:benzoate/toluate 1,2-dioxygenase beta subunit